MKNVISASRRTDIPAFYSEWFVNRLKAGFVYVKNPFSRKWTRISLKSEDVSVIVFWSKNFAPLLSRLETIEQTTKNLFFHFTITGNRELEFNSPDYIDTVKNFIYLSRRYSPKRIVWRFDPICITDKLSFEVYKERFIKCAEILKSYAEICYISFVTPYKKVINNMQKYTHHTLIEISEGEKKKYALQLVDIAERYDIKIYACCNDYLLSEGVKKGSCINGYYLSNIFNIQIETKLSPTRKECACTKSIDIGTYDTCAHECIYCYANTDKEKARIMPAYQNSEWNALGTNAAEDEIELLIENQLSLFSH
jgi:hypothetical protein